MKGLSLDAVRAALGRVHRAVGLGAGLVALGFVVMYLGWRGSSRTFFVPSQMSFLISGGVIGLALVGTGLVAIAAHVVRVGTARRSYQLGLVTDDVRSLVELAGRQPSAERSAPS